MVLQGKDEVITATEQKIAVQLRALSDKQQRVSSLAKECATLKGKLEGHSEQILSLQARINTLKVSIRFVRIERTNDVIILCQTEGEG